MRKDFEDEIDRHINFAARSGLVLSPDVIVGSFLQWAQANVTRGSRESMLDLATQRIGTGVVAPAPTAVTPGFEGSTVTLPTPPPPRPVISTEEAVTEALEATTPATTYRTPAAAYAPLTG